MITLDIKKIEHLNDGRLAIQLERNLCVSESNITNDLNLEKITVGHIIIYDEETIKEIKQMNLERAYLQ